MRSRDVPDKYYRYARRSGWTYIVQGVDGGPIKIGSTLHDNPDKRLRQLQGASPKRLHFIHIIPGIANESALHQALANYRLHGEWFDERCLEEQADYFRKFMLLPPDDPNPVADLFRVWCRARIKK